MSDFLLFVEDLVRRYPVHIDIYYSKILDWCIRIWKNGEEYLEICAVQDLDMELAFAKAHVALKEWLREHEGGY